MLPAFAGILVATLVTLVYEAVGIVVILGAVYIQVTLGVEPPLGVYQGALIVCSAIVAVSVYWTVSAEVREGLKGWNVNV